MPLEAACIAYAGLAQIARSSGRYRHRGTRFWSRGGGATRTSGIILLIISFVMAMLRFGPTQGAVAWAGLLSLGGIALLLLLSRWPRIAFVLALPALPVAALFWAV